MVEYPR